MTEARQEFDPRYDPRFQRGYVAADHEGAAPLEPAPERSPAEPALDAVPRRATAADPEAGRSRRAVDQAGPATATAVPAAGPPAGVPGEPTAGGVAAAAPDPGGTSSTPSVVDDARSTSQPPAPFVATRWLWLVLAASALLIVVGVASYWSLIGGRGAYGYAMGTDEAVRSAIVSALGPALAEVGVLGIVGVLLAWALVAGGRRERR
ncbi:hypothetical protein ABIQ69_15695 [Agromyces sp. G08B096]|uniref:Uncharacterized protein n=1 Tax=Agromyces sp. G08B096 TaxID=3156399 RepID=A0AAU7W6I6_9MICO